MNVEEFFVVNAKSTIFVSVSVLLQAQTAHIARKADTHKIALSSATKLYIVVDTDDVLGAEGRVFASADGLDSAVLPRLHQI